MARTTKVLGFSVPPALAQEVDRVAEQEQRTKSELFREMFRVYKRYREQRERDDERWVMDLIREAKREQEENPMTVEEMLAESDRLAHYGARKAKEMGIRPKDIDRLIHEFRAKNRT